jgi:transposase-like protein
MQERPIQEVRRKERAVRIFSNESPAFQLMGDLLAESHEEKQALRYLDITDFHEWVAERLSSSEDAVVSLR